MVYHCTVSLTTLILIVHAAQSNAIYYIDSAELPIIGMDMAEDKVFDWPPIPVRVLSKHAYRQLLRRKLSRRLALRIPQY